MTNHLRLSDLPHSISREQRHEGMPACWVIAWAHDTVFNDGVPRCSLPLLSNLNKYILNHYHIVIALCDTSFTINLH